MIKYLNYKIIIIVYYLKYVKFLKRMYALLLVFILKFQNLWTSTYSEYNFKALF